jgi:hypothetical protein
MDRREGAVHLIERSRRSGAAMLDASHFPFSVSARIPSCQDGSRAPGWMRALGCARLEARIFFRATVTILFKGAAPGTYWRLNDPTVRGFQAPGTLAPGVPTMITHITTASASSSPYLSFTASFAVAHSYASAGATASTPGAIYEVDVTGLGVVDPIRSISGHSAFRPNSQLPLPSHHDGGQDLILGVAASHLHGSVLITPPVTANTHVPNPPIVTTDFRALVYALRDAEVLVLAPVAARCIRRVFHVV